MTTLPQHLLTAENSGKSSRVDEYIARSAARFTEQRQISILRRSRFLPFMSIFKEMGCEDLAQRNKSGLPSTEVELDLHTSKNFTKYCGRCILHSGFE